MDAITGGRKKATLQTTSQPTKFGIKFCQEICAVSNLAALKYCIFKSHTRCIC